MLEKTPQHTSEFLSQTIPFYAANTTFKRLRASYKDYVMREAALNPTNLDDRATEWEVDLINYFRNNPGQTQRWGKRETPTGPVLYVASPIIAAPGCLTCHSQVSLAPRAMIKHYGRDHGFGWKANESWAHRSSRCRWRCRSSWRIKGFRNLLISLGAIFLLTIILIDVAMYMIVIRPLRQVSKNADIISKGEIDLPPLEIKGKGRDCRGTASFNRMHTSLIKAFEMLNG